MTRAPAPSQAMDPPPQLMQVSAYREVGNVTEMMSPPRAAGKGTKGTAFYVDIDTHKVVVAPYHLLALLRPSGGPAQVYLAGCAPLQDGMPCIQWSEETQVLGADPAEDVLFLAAPPELRNTPELRLAGNVSMGSRLHGSGYADGKTSLKEFSGDLAFSGSVTEMTDETGQPWRWSAQQVYWVRGEGVEPGDSGSPALTTGGLVAGEVVAAGGPWIVVIPATAIRQAWLERTSTSSLMS